MTLFTYDVRNVLRVRPTATPTLPLVCEASCQSIDNVTRTVMAGTPQAVDRVYRPSLPITVLLEDTSATPVTPSSNYDPIPEATGWQVLALRVYNPNTSAVTVEVGRYEEPGNTSSDFLVLYRQTIQAQQTFTLNGDGVASLSGPFSAAPLDYQVEVQRGHVAGHTVIYKYGSVDMGGTSSGVDCDIWDRGGASDTPVYPYQSSASVLEISSSSADDDAAGGGAEAIIVYGVDGDWEFIEEQVTLDGTTTVETVATFLRVYRARTISPTQTYPQVRNVGNIDIVHKASTDVLARISAGNGSTFQTHMVVPAGKRGYFLSMEAHHPDKTSGISLIAAEASTDGGPWIRQNLTTVSNEMPTSTYAAVFPHPPGGMPPKTDIKFIANPSANNLRAAVAYELLLIDEDAAL